MAKESIRIRRLNDDRIETVISGESAKISQIICETMIVSEETAAIIMSSIPKFLEEKKIDKQQFLDKYFFEKTTK